jgi:hypothetical protein
MRAVSYVGATVAGGLVAGVLVLAGCGVSVQSSPQPLTAFPTAPAPTPTIAQRPDRAATPGPTPTPASTPTPTPTPTPTLTPAPPT